MSASGLPAWAAASNSYCTPWLLSRTPSSHKHWHHWHSGRGQHVRSWGRPIQNSMIWSSCPSGLEATSAWAAALCCRPAFKSANTSW